jgi:prolycopene isomerase
MEVVMADYDAVVVGAGNGGLTAAVTLAKKGRKVFLLEKHNVPGGCATTFCRGRFEMEVALHQLSSMGTPENPGPLRMMFQELGILHKLKFVISPSMYRIVVPGSMDIELPADRAATLTVLQKQFPSEKEAIEAFMDLVYKLCMEWVSVFVMRDPEASPEKYPLYFKYRLKDSKSVLDAYFKDPLLKLALGIYWLYIGLPPSKMTFFDLALMLWVFLEMKPGHVKGGSQAMSASLLDTFFECGGEARFNCAAKKMILENKRIKAVVTEDGDTVTTDYVISNAGIIPTYMDMIGPEHIPEEELKIWGTRTIGPSAINLYIGLDCEPSTLGIVQGAIFICKSADMEYAYKTGKTLAQPEAAMVSCYEVDDPDFSPAGTCQLSVVALQYGEPWMTISPDRYFEEKWRCGEGIMKLIDPVIPGYRDHIEELDVATPVTMMRYLGQPGGAIYGADQPAKDSPLFLGPISPIEGLYFSGAWVTTGGFHPTLQSGITAARAVLSNMKKNRS